MNYLIEMLIHNQYNKLTYDYIKLLDLLIEKSVEGNTI